MTSSRRGSLCEDRLLLCGNSHVPIWRDPRRGFGRLILDPVATKQATKTALEVGFDTSISRDAYRNEKSD